MNVLSLDVESTTHNKGNPYDSRNELVCYSFATEKGHTAFRFEGPNSVQVLVDGASLLVGFNFKFDYHWLAKEGVDLSKKEIWDVQIAEFILSNQTQKFPSLNDTCLKYGIEQKLDVVKTEYWDKGINTDEIPWHVLKEYAAHDAKVTLLCYHAQQKIMTPKQKQLCRLMCMDLHILREMECNGVLYDEQLCIARSLEVDDKVSEIKRTLAATYPHVPINFGSGDHLSAFLYGGIVKEDAKEHIGFYKTGDKAGQPKYKNVVVEHVLPKMYEPLKGTELKKEGYYATDVGTLKKLKGKKDVVNLLLELSALEKLNSTYYKGLPSLREEMHWEPGVLHGQFNQTLTATGRLSSSRPNQQNFASEIQDIFISQFND